MERMIDNSKEYLLCAAIRRVEPRDCPKVYWGTIPRHLQNRIGLETSRYNAPIWEGSITQPE